MTATMALACAATNRDAKCSSRHEGRRSRRHAPREVRARSHSPVRHAPKLAHTNGRLDAPLPTELTSFRSVDKIAESIDEEGLRGLSAAQKASLLGVREDVYRAASSPAPASAAPRKFKIFYRDDNFRDVCARNTRDVLAAARQAEHRDPSDAAVSNQQQLALKALKYRKLLGRARQIDEKLLADPRFDVLEFMGATWCKV